MNGQGVPSKDLYRQVTAMGTVGELGQLFTVYEKNWRCPDCQQENYASKRKCLRCKCNKPANQDNYVMDPALEAMKKGETIQWKEAIDPTTYQVYYFNTTTGATQWERPQELGPTPMATGWFGRGAAGSNAKLHYDQQNKTLLSRPARKQKDFIDPKKYINESAGDYNIWYGRHLGDYNDNAPNRDPAPDRCVLLQDGGFTKADGVGKDHSLHRKDRRFFCLHFAHGQCAKGAECIFFHRIPTQEDDARCDELFDCFGRSKHSKHRDDMNGVGSFTKPCRTLYVGNLIKTSYSTPKVLEEALWKHFGEWGELESVNVIHRLSIAFPRYRFRTNAEFAKEAMSNQTVDHNEVLMIRWAYDDPNPVAQDAINRADKDAIASLLQSKGISLQQAGFEYPIDYALPAAKRMKGDEGDGGSVGDSTLADFATLHPELAYPNTDAQYSAAAAAGADNAQQTAAAYAEYIQKYYAANGDKLQEQQLQQVQQVQVQDPSCAGGSSQETKDSRSGSSSSSDSKKGWTEQEDPATGATYYFNNISGESSWTPPPGFA